MATHGRPKAECEVHLLADAPSNQDELGQHTSCARAILSLIDSANRGVTIGLVGSWGSGKSTVVSLFTQLVAARKDLSVVMFDAWAHEGDPLRRGFLGTLVSDLSNAGWIRAKDWESELNRLSGKERTETQTSHPILSFAGWVYIFSLLFAPIGAILLSDALRNGVSRFAFVWGVEPQSGLGVFLLLAPVFVVLWKAAVVAWREDFRCARIIRELPRELAPFNQRGTTTTESHTKQDGDATSLEFEQLYARIVDAALAEQGRTLVLVIDNLDRVDRDTAHRLWSTLQTFLTPGGRSGNARRVSVVVPYDRKALARIWGDVAERDASESKESRAEALAIATSYINKAIQVVVDVPRPVLGGWGKYLNTSLSRALPAHQAAVDELHTIYRLYDAFTTEAKREPTPREIKLFVNELVAVHVRVSHDIPLVYQAYYVLISRFRSDAASWVLGGATMGHWERLLLPDEAAKAVAAIAFNVDQGSALQVVTGRGLKGALAKGDAEGLKSLLANEAETTLVLERVLGEVGEQWIGPEQPLFNAALLAIHGSGVCDRVKNASVGRIVTHLATVLKDEGTMAVPTATSAASVGWLLTRPETRILRSELLKQVEAKLSSGLAGAEQAATLEAIGPIASALAEVSSVPDGGNPVALRLDVEAGVLFLALAGAAKAGANAMRSVVPASDWSGVSDYVGEQAATGEWTDTYTTVVQNLVEARQPLNWAVVANAMVEGLAATEWVYEPADVEALLGLLDAIERAHEVAPDASRLVTEGHLLSHLARAKAKGQQSVMVACMCKLYRADPSLVTLADGGPSKAGVDAIGELLQDGTATALMQGVAHRLQARAEQRLLFTPTPTPLGRRIAVAIAGHLLERGVESGLLAPPDIIDHWGFLSEATGNIPITNRAKVADSVAGKLVERPWDLSSWAIGDTIYRDCSPTEQAKIGVWALGGLRAIEQAAWERILREGGQELAVAKTVAAREPKGRVRIARLKEALTVVASEGMRAGEREMIERLLEALHLYEPDEQDYSRKEIVDRLCVVGGDAGEVFLAVMTPELEAVPDAFKNGDIPRKVLKPLVKAQKRTAIEWIERLSASKRSVLFQAQRADLLALADALDEMKNIQDANPDVVALAQAAAARLRPAPGKGAKG